MFYRFPLKLPFKKLIELSFGRFIDWDWLGVNINYYKRAEKTIFSLRVEVVGYFLAVKVNKN